MLEWMSGISAFVISFVSIPYIRILAFRWGFLDQPNQRKVHAQPLPLLGGSAMFVAILLTLGVDSFFRPAPFALWGLFVGSLVLFAIGLVDDYAKSRGRDFSALPRLLAQIFAAVLVASFGGLIRGFSVPFGGEHYIVFPHWLAIAMTIVWVVGVINVFNFLDGLDGLAAGIAAISATTLVFIALVKGDLDSALWAAAVAGAALGFLRHNFYPARIIMGDAGSTLLGYWLAAISVIGAFKSATVISVFVPVLALGVPIFDGILVVVKRALAGKPVYKPDKTHSHHRLLNAGMSQVHVVTFMYLVSVCFSLMSMIVVLWQK